MVKFKVQELLQEPKIVLLRRHCSALEMRNDFGKHLRIFDGYRQVLLLYRLPIDSAELVHLLDEIGRNLIVNGLVAVGWTLDLDLDREGVAVIRVGLAILVTSVVAQQIGVFAQVDKGAAIGH